MNHKKNVPYRTIWDAGIWVLVCYLCHQRHVRLWVAVAIFLDVCLLLFASNVFATGTLDPTWVGSVCARVILRCMSESFVETS